MHSNHRRSAFESMVLNSTGTLHRPAAVSTAGSIYGWIQKIHPSALHGADHIKAFEDMKKSERSGEPKQDLSYRCHEEEVYRHKFDYERLFEVVVMYLFNGLKASGDDADTGSKALLHYIVYMIPEADKLKVLDLGGNVEKDAKSVYIQRMKNVRVIFDHTDYKFRVIVKKGGTEHGWIDICLELRKAFTTMINGLVVKNYVEIEDNWVDIVKGFKPILLESIARYTAYDRVSIEKWVLQDVDIAWETSTYAAGDVHPRNVLEHTNTDHEATAPFIISYWADNYLEFEDYKISRMFNGLVGYGEFLYERDNNYSRKATNNFFFVVNQTKKWLWKDIPRDAGPRTLLNQPLTEATANERERGNILEAVIERGVLYVTPGFSKMVTRRQDQAWSSEAVNCIGQICILILLGPGKWDCGFVGFFWILAEIYEYINSEMVSLFTNGLEGGKLSEDVLMILYNKFISYCYAVGYRTNGPINDFHMETEMPPYMIQLINKMLRFGIHIQREKWLMKYHTQELPFNVLRELQQQYTNNFWDSFNSKPSSVKTNNPTAIYVPKPRRDGKSMISDIAVGNNSTLK
jgi:hypothetical protein